MTNSDTSSPTSPLDHSGLATALAGQYRIERELGRGGMGVVYLARDLKLDRRVAVKTLLPHLADDPAIRERFLREARTAGSLSHPNIVPIHRADELDGHVFFVMGFVDGTSMASLVAENGRIPPADAVRYLRDVATALDYAHARGIVHRDVKAENILIAADTGRAMVTDFGIARLSESAPLTATGQMLGTVYYLSPEQVSGDPVDGRSDIYSLGVAGFFALSGRFPFNAALASAVVVAHVTKAPPKLRDVAPGIPAPLAAIIDRCLAKDPADRFPDCAALAAALGDVMPLLSTSTRDSTTRRPTLSDDEAQSVWERAAQLQAQTGIVPRPAPVPMERDVAADRNRTSGFDLGDVRAAADEAGIPAKYVEHALAERGLAGGAASRALPAVVQNLSRGGKWMDAPTIIEFEMVLSGEVPSRDFDILGDSIQRTVGTIGTLTQVGQSLTWHPNEDRKLQITVFARNGTTTIRATENLRHIVGGLFGGMVGGGTGSMGSLIFALMAANGHPGVAGVYVAALGGTLLLSAAAIFGTVSNRKQKTLRDIVDNLAEHARESIERSGPKKLPPF